MHHSEKTIEAAQRIIDKIVKSKYPVAVFMLKDGLEYFGTYTKRYEFRMANSPNDMIGIYNCNVSNVDLMDDLESAGVK